MDPAVITVELNMACPKCETRQASAKLSKYRLGANASPFRTEKSAGFSPMVSRV